MSTQTCWRFVIISSFNAANGHGDCEDDGDCVNDGDGGGDDDESVE